MSRPAKPPEGGATIYRLSLPPAGKGLRHTKRLATEFRRVIESALVKAAVDREYLFSWKVGGANSKTMVATEKPQDMDIPKPKKARKPRSKAQKTE